jgi:ribosomal protein S13
MARISGIDLPRDKRIETALTYIYGIGETSAQQILEVAGISPDTRVRDLSEADARACVKSSSATIALKATCAAKSTPASSAWLRSVHIVACVTARTAGSRPAHQDQCTHSQGAEEDGRRQAQQEVIEKCGLLSTRGPISGEHMAEQRTSRKAKKAAAKGQAYIQSTFNNTIVSITDGEGQHLRLGFGGHGWFQGHQEGHALRRAGRRAERGASRHGRRYAPRDVFVKGPGSGRETAIRAWLRPDGNRQHPRRHADPAQRLPPAQASSRLVFVCTP